mmetsp:Transcript_2777/g.7700  ORF Transcript_2777/g.7700 Transcript_2777/m.7700 type:complete len:224 (+) Transcript_2777:215-886(+)|eukprot:CAMPEP_0119123722 /NCGR_PEP_ID=MMETSP1310-20130426/3576_1 /TAXON_ID=464262 /ORGANISM="Genus nov. species nov., Strain RCC2339" /LENGTH=223 /DNA_ID=CAMNT_0007113581 /DNA_START=191 /DNA_END=862 /DNA_ORIENTATION=+
MSSEDEELAWVSWFCCLKGNELFCEVDDDYIQDDFNLTGLRSMVPHYDYALDLILDTETDEVLNDEQQEIIESAAEVLYGLIHARYIITSRGLAAMLEKFENVEFGRCPRAFCQGQPVLPVGQSDVPRTFAVKLFCPKCQDIYHPRLSRHATVDGSYFGTTFPHMLLQTYPEYQPRVNTQTYTPRIFGFKIHPTSHEEALKAKQEAKMYRQRMLQMQVDKMGN